MLILAEVAVSFMLVVAGFFGFVGALGLLVLPDPMTRLHGPTKAATLGVGASLIASLIWFPTLGDGLSVQELLITLFLLVTAPITGYFIARVNMFQHWRKKDLSDPGERREWAGYSDPDRTQK